MRANDALDILIVAAVFYLFLAWLRASLPSGVARRSMVAAPIATATYVLARWFDLYLLQQTLEALLLVVLVGAVVVYQTDIRRMLERALSGRGASEPASRPLESLTEAATHLAAEKTGALMAIRGREPWAAHIHGGVELHGALSAPLLYSIFDPATPGHDGAVLIENGVLTRFAAHLPLASDLPEASRFGGTRHAAALGLSQECDAFIIVVSEERGTISVAEGGTLVGDVSAGELAERLHRFWRRCFEEEPAASRRLRTTARLQTAFVSLALASALWLVLVYSPDTLVRSFTVPIALRNLGESWVTAGAVPAGAEIELAGSERSFRELDADSLTISIDLSQPTRGIRQVVIGEDSLALPSGITLRRARPATVSVELQAARPVHIPVVIPTIGALPGTLELVSVRADPDTVILRVPEGTTAPDQVFTAPLDLRQITGDTTRNSQLVIPPDAHLPQDASTQVSVRVAVRPRARE
jgi:diadenylate cyclase